MNKEYKFIIKCLRKFIGIDNTNIDNNNVDCVKLYKICVYHKILPIICEVLPKDDKFQVMINNGLEMQKYNNLINKIKLEECKALFDQLSKEYISYVLLKGHIISMLSYKSLKYRTFSDIDILIDRNDCTNVSKILTENEFIQAYIDNKKVIPYSREQKLFYILNTHQLAPFIKINKDIPFSINIDINFKLTYGEDKDSIINISNFIKDFLICKCVNIDLPILSYEKNLIQLCLHNYKDANSIFLIYENRYLKLLNLVDIYLYIKNNFNNIDWNKFNKLINEYNIEKPIFFILDYIRKILDHSFLNKEFFEKLNIKSDFVQEIGLSEDEKITLTENYWTLILTENPRKIITKYLTENHYSKINANNKYL